VIVSNLFIFDWFIEVLFTVSTLLWFKLFNEVTAEGVVNWVVWLSVVLIGNWFLTWVWTCTIFDAVVVVTVFRDSFILFYMDELEKRGNIYIYIYIWILFINILFIIIL